MQNKNFLFVALILLFVGLVLFFFQGMFKPTSDFETETGNENHSSNIEEDYANNTGDIPPLTLETTEWVWIRTDLGSGGVVRPGNSFFKMNLEFNKMVSRTDCNSFSANYVLDGEVLSFSPVTSTKMFCEGSVDAKYGEHLRLVNSYEIEGNMLRFNLNRDFGTMYFAEKYYVEDNPELIICPTDLMQCGGGKTTKRIAPTCIHEACE